MPVVIANMFHIIGFAWVLPQLIGNEDHVVGHVQPGLQLWKESAAFCHGKEVK